MEIIDDKCSLAAVFIHFSDFSHKISSDSGTLYLTTINASWMRQSAKCF